MLRLIKMMAAVGALALPQIAHSQEEINDYKGFAALNIDFDGRGSYLIAVGPRERQGKLVICGIAWTADNAGGIGRRATNFLDLLTIRLDGELIKVKATQFNRYNSTAEADRGRARCLPSGKDWKPSHARAKIKLSTRGNEL